VGCPLWLEVGSVVFTCFWASPVQSFSGLSPTGVIAIFYSLNFLDSPNLEGQVPEFVSHRNKVAQLYPRALDSPRLVLLITSRHGLHREHRLSIAVPLWRSCLLAELVIVFIRCVRVCSRSRYSNGRWVVAAQQRIYMPLFLLLISSWTIMRLPVCIG
jgi:hypothetical protein